MSDLTAETLRELLDYDPKTGMLAWRVARSGTNGIGSIAGCVNENGYRRICIHGRRFLAHRLAWLYVHGVWPANEIDHINGVRRDNRLANLREATRSENKRNEGANTRNTSGFKGVCWNKRERKWTAEIVVNGKRSFLGLFSTPKAAHVAYCAAAKRLHGKFARVA